MKQKVPKVKGAKPTKKIGKPMSDKVKNPSKAVGVPRMRMGHAKMSGNPIKPKK